MVWKTLIDASCYIIDASKSHAFVRCIARAALNFYFIFLKKNFSMNPTAFLIPWITKMREN